MEKKFVAYEGEQFTIEWYFDSRGKSVALDFYKELTQNQKEKLFYLFYMLADTGKIRNEEKFRYEGDQIYAFKISPDRFLCFFYEGARVIVTNAYVKKTDKMPLKEKQRSVKSKADYVKRYNEGSYYD